MVTLRADITASQTILPVSTPDVEPGSFYAIGSESIRVFGSGRDATGRSFDRRYWSVDRGVAGTTPASHSSGATLTRYYPDANNSGGGSGSITADQQAALDAADPPLDADHPPLTEAGGLQTVSVELTTDPDTFVAPTHTFDFGPGAHTVQLTMTGTALTGDGETFGNDAGTIYAGPIFWLVSDLSELAAIRAEKPLGQDSVLQPVSNYVAAADGFVLEVQALDQSSSAVGIVPRYLVTEVGIYSNDTGSLYAGANHPTVTATVTVEYR